MMKPSVRWPGRNTRVNAACAARSGGKVAWVAVSLSCNSKTPAVLRTAHPWANRDLKRPCTATVTQDIVRIGGWVTLLSRSPTTVNDEMGDVDTFWVSISGATDCTNE